MTHPPCENTRPLQAATPGGPATPLSKPAPKPRGRKPSMVSKYFTLKTTETGQFIENKCKLCGFASTDKSKNATYLTRHVLNSCTGASVETRLELSMYVRQRSSYKLGPNAVRAAEILSQVDRSAEGPIDVGEAAEPLSVKIGATRRGRPRSRVRLHFERLVDDKGKFIANRCTYCAEVSKDRSENPTLMKRHLLSKSCSAPTEVTDTLGTTSRKSSGAGSEGDEQKRSQERAGSN